MAASPPFSSGPTTPTDTRVNLTTDGPFRPSLDRKDGLEPRAAVPQPSRRPARNLVDVPAPTPLSGAGASTPTGSRLAWHEISYRDPRKGARTLRWVKLPDAREQAKKVAARLKTEVEIWAVYRDATGRETHSAFVEVVR
ncbi:hypothetical protein [Terrabacter terrigena]|uniref:Uncharacterized protein n=1 Tax=Terrabacter terrigena TaxID=574718 RepID=A0ABW3N049_9MICO